jgi:hemoglobin-like flavoprotein
MHNLSNDQIQLIKSSWTHVIAYSDKAGEVFYRHFFALAPQAQALFQNDLEKQNHKLLATISLIVAKLPKIEQIHEELRGLAHRHNKYGAKIEYFAPFGKAFMAMLAEVMAGGWSDEMQAVWLQVFQIISQAMVADMSQDLANL